MKIEAKPRTIVAIVVAVVIVTCGYLYLERTKQVRAYKKELRMFQMIKEHQRLEILIMKQKAELDAMKKAAEDAIPAYKLTPAEGEKKQKALEEMNKDLE